MPDSLIRTPLLEGEFEDLPQEVERVDDLAELREQVEFLTKQFASRLAQAVDVLRTQGAMTNTQLAYALKMNRNNCANNVTGVLLRQGLAVRNGNEVSLK